MSKVEATRPVVVGVDGSVDALQAVDWAAREATRHGWPVKLVHAYEAPVAAVPGVSVTLPTPSEESARILEEARGRIAAAFPELEVTTIQREGPAPKVLLRGAAEARMLVLGREGLGRFSEFVLGSVSLAVATRAKVPVVVVPGSWKPPEQPFNRIVIGVDGSENCQPAVEFAFETAAVRGAELVAVFAWDLPSRWPEARLIDAGSPELKADYQQILKEATQLWQEKYPSVPVELVGTVGRPAEVLREHAANADLVVIGGRGHGALTGMLLGSAARSILRHLDRPIAVIHAAGKN